MQGIVTVMPRLFYGISIFTPQTCPAFCVSAFKAVVVNNVLAYVVIIYFDDYFRGNQRFQIRLPLLGVPKEVVPVYLDIGRHCVQECINGREVQITIVLYHRRMFHCISRSEHLKVSIGHGFVCRVIDIQVGSQAKTYCHIGRVLCRIGLDIVIVRYLFL